MKAYIKIIFSAFPLMIGIIMTLISLCYLVQFFEYGLDFEDSVDQFIAFLILFLFGFPSILFGITKLTKIEN